MYKAADYETRNKAVRMSYFFFFKKEVNLVQYIKSNTGGWVENTKAMKEYS